jgi:hypothetical protein
MRLEKLNGTHTECSASSGKAQTCPWPHIANEQWHA